MKTLNLFRFLPLFVALFISGLSHSQDYWPMPFPAVGTVNQLQVADTTFQPAQTGAGVWNFASLVPIIDSLITDSFLSASSTPYGATFPAATVTDHEMGAGLNEFYYYQSVLADSVTELIGLATPGLDTIVYSSPLLEYLNPLLYGNSNYNSSFRATLSYIGNPAVMLGTYSDTVDEIGQLIIPSGSFDDVWRTHSFQIFSDTITGTSAKVNTVIEAYNWYVINYNYPLLTYITTTSTGTISSYSKVVAYKAGPTAINPVSAAKTNCRLFPNPASTGATLVYEANTAGNSTISVYDMSGRLLQNMQVNDSPGILQTRQLDFSTLAPGLYHLVVKNEAGISDSKFEVAR